MTREELGAIIDNSNFAIDSNNPYDMKILEALEKQVPKKPHTAKDERSEAWMIDDIFICPSCGGFIGWIIECKEEPYQTPYCSQCGQALLWEDTE